MKTKLKHHRKLLSSSYVWKCAWLCLSVRLSQCNVVKQWEEGRIWCSDSYMTSCDVGEPHYYLLPIYCKRYHSVSCAGLLCKTIIWRQREVLSHMLVWTVYFSQVSRSMTVKLYKFQELTLQICKEAEKNPQVSLFCADLTCDSVNL